VSTNPSRPLRPALAVLWLGTAAAHWHCSELSILWPALEIAPWHAALALSSSGRAREQGRERRGRKCMHEEDTKGRGVNRQRRRHLRSLAGVQSQDEGTKRSHKAYC